MMTLFLLMLVVTSVRKSALTFARKKSARDARRRVIHLFMAVLPPGLS